MNVDPNTFIVTLSLTQFNFWVLMLNLGLLVSWWNWRQVAKNFGVSTVRAVVYGLGLLLAANATVFAITSAIKMPPMTLG